ncbi:MAG: proline--tRNA ligase [Kiritimatiellae bacterium]|nr:proline--tRNA ligase [Kiritimatiellia bacterium]MDD5520418.1 proline--tRNA ligase [Kiritimatiellia bacterium]
MKWSKTIIPTLRDNPQEAEIDSHKLMLRAGLIRKLGGGLYTFLPLGLRALRKVENIIREEMDRAGALEVLMPALQPREIWDTSERYETMQNVLYHVFDRQKREMLLGPTHEEVITDLVAREISSYRQMPKTFYQIQTKFRDEIRPRFGLMRAKEFIMKDAYSFDTGWDEADASYQAMYDAYTRIFQRCGLRTKTVEADTGAIGGKWSHEFMVMADSGEDGIVECEACSYAANLEKAERALPVTKVFPDNDKLPEEISTPGMRTIDEVSGFLKSEPMRLIKTLIYLINGNPTAILVAGDREINEHKIARLLETSNVMLADDKTIEKATGAPVGFAGPVGLNIPVYADIGLRGYSGAITGANKKDTHLLNVDLERDAKIQSYMDLCTVKEGDKCPRCQASLKEKRGIEVGHVFKLGTKYSEKFSAIYLDEKGEKKPVVMGCYGIGVTRTLQSVIEQSHDAKGIIWPVSVAPYSVVIVVPNTGHNDSVKAAETLMASLEQKKIDVLLDDRDERPGVKFNDADLLGFPIRVVISERSLAKNSIEIKLRSAEKAEIIPIDLGESRILELCKT